MDTYLPRAGTNNNNSLQQASFKRLFYLIRDLPLDAEGNVVVQSMPTTPFDETHPSNAPDWRRGGMQTGPARLQKSHPDASQSPYALGKGAYSRFWQNSAESPDKRKQLQRRNLKSAPGKQENPPLDFDRMADEEEEALAQGGGLAAIRAAKK